MAQITAASMETYFCTPVRLSFISVVPGGCKSEKPPIIFVHGITASKENWNDIPQIVANATKRKVYAVDSRNHGDSEWTDYSDLDCNVVDLLNFMDSINAPKAVIVGHSMGGVTGIKAALKQPERIEKLIVEDMTVKSIPTKMIDLTIQNISLVQAATQQLPVGIDEDAAKKFISEFVNKGLPPEIQKIAGKPRPDDFNGNLKPTTDGRYTLKANFIGLRKSAENAKLGTSENTGVYEGPACFIYGKLSPMLVGEDECIKKCFPNAELVGIENATHRVHTECPSEFTKILLKFILKE